MYIYVQVHCVDYTLHVLCYISICIYSAYMYIHLYTYTYTYIYICVYAFFQRICILLGVRAPSRAPERTPKGAPKLWAPSSMAKIQKREYRQHGVHDFLGAILAILSILGCWAPSLDPVAEGPRKGCRAQNRTPREDSRSIGPTIHDMDCSSHGPKRSLPISC